MGYDQLQKAWKEANERVRDAEERLAEAWNAFSSGKGPAPAPGLLAEVAGLRRECDQRLSEILGGLNEARRTNGDHHQGVTAPGSRAQTRH
jgi:hypothetical protein